MGCRLRHGTTYSRGIASGRKAACVTGHVLPPRNGSWVGVRRRRCIQDGTLRLAVAVAVAGCFGMGAHWQAQQAFLGTSAAAAAYPWAVGQCGNNADGTDAWTRSGNTFLIKTRLQTCRRAKGSRPQTCRLGVQGRMMPQ